MKYEGIPWLDDDRYAKERWHYKVNLEEGLKRLGFDKYGMKDYLPAAVDMAWKLAEDFALIARGVDKMIDIERVSNGRYRADD